jgi:hypothetical protein
VSVWAAAALLCGALGLVVAEAAGAAGLGYAAMFALALAPGLPVGCRLFGRRHAGAWIAGAALGYFLTSLALWAAIALHAAGAAGFVVAWLAAVAAGFGVSRAIGSADALVKPESQWIRRDTTALLLVLLIVPALAGPPFARLGERDGEGNRYYRAYFTADFVWHMAVTSELDKFSMPPRNMFMPNRPLNYYWAYYLLPAAISGSAPGPLSSVENNLKVNAIGTALLLVSAMFLLAWVVVPQGWAVAAAVLLAIIASSAEGFYEISRLLARNAPLRALRDVNIDAISNWRFGGLRVDGIPRCFWWVPQHSMSYVMGLSALAVLAAVGAGASVGVIVAEGLLLAACVAFNPFVGALFAAVWGLAVIIDAWRRSAGAAPILRAFLAAIPVGLALVWCITTRMVGGAPSVIQFGLLGNAAHRPLWNLALSLGPALAPAIVGVFALRHQPAAQRATPAIVLVVVSLLIMHLVRLSVDDSWVGFRAGQMLLIALPGCTAAAFAYPGTASKLAGSIAVLALIIGLPTTLVDVYNAQDITNRSEGPGFRWTEVLDVEHQEALTWMKRATRPIDVIQLDPTARGSTTWTIIPSFGERRMAASLPRTLVDVPEYHERSAKVHDMFATTNAQHAWDIAHGLRIDYVYVDGVERAAYPDGVAKFEASSLFGRAFRNGEVTIYKVN